MLIKMTRADLIKFGLLLSGGSSFYMEKEYIEIMADKFIKSEELLRLYPNKFERDFELSRYTNRGTKD